MKLSFVGVGPMRAGTTWLHAALARHPRVVLPREKETFYFDRHHGRGLEWYEAHFPPAGAGAVFGEIGASYFASTEARERIFQAAPDALILVNVRDPVDRAFSTYVHFQKTRELPPSVVDAVRVAPEILESGAYSLHLPAWEARFGDDRVELLTMGEIKSQPAEALARILRRLGLPPLDPSLDLNASVNDAYVPPSARLHRVRAAVFRYLVDHQHFRALGAARAIKRGVQTVVPPVARGARAMSAEERAFLEERLAGERAFLEERLARRGQET
jgi:hypothetical protein